MSITSHNPTEPLSELGVSLLIRRGQTTSRVRPVNSEKFLIGSGAACDLQLGGDPLSALHSILHVDGADVWIEAMSAQPVMVNHHAVESCLLRNGDCVEIGPFEFQMQIESSQSQVQHFSATGSSRVRRPHFDLDAMSTTETVQRLSANQLVDAIDHELELIERFESRRHLGADALLKALMARKTEANREDDNEFLSQHDEVTVSPHEMPVPRTVESFADVDHVFDHIQATLRQLEQRSAGLEEREDAFAEAAATLLEVQERFAQQLEAIQQNLTEGQTARRPLRASA